ncbi:hypothetical protein GCM10009660_34970 [Catellatospora bangladeshensis]
MHPAGPGGGEQFVVLDLPADGQQGLVAVDELVGVRHGLLLRAPLRPGPGPAGAADGATGGLPGRPPRGGSHDIGSAASP